MRLPILTCMESWIIASRHVRSARTAAAGSLGISGRLGRLDMVPPPRMLPIRSIAGGAACLEWELSGLRHDPSFVDRPTGRGYRMTCKADKKPGRIFMSDSFLLDLVNRATNSWVRRWSLVALPPLRMKARGNPRQTQRNRDIFILTMFSASAAMVVLFHFASEDGAAFWERAIAAIALYRCVDIFITLIRTGIFLNFRGDIQLREEPTWRIQRISCLACFSTTSN